MAITQIRGRGEDDLAGAASAARAASCALAVKLHWALRVGVALEFIGHGVAGLYRPAAWIPYFTFFGIPESFAHDYMTYVTGTLDIALGILVLVRPMRVVMLHMAVWGLMTAWLRPLTGESWFELVERGANYGMPLAFLVLSGWGGRSLRAWFERVRPPEGIGEELARQLEWIIRASIVLLLVGHGGLGIWAAKAEWFDFLGWVGVTDASQAAEVIPWVGVFEVVLGLAVLIKPLRGLLLFVLAWKLGTELLRPLVGQPNYQFVERAGDYVLPLALLWLAHKMVPAVRAADPDGQSEHRAGEEDFRVPAGTVSKTVSVKVSGDRLKEADETFLVNLSSSVGAILEDAQGVGTILNDDGAPSPDSNEPTSPQSASPNPSSPPRAGRARLRRTTGAGGQAPGGWRPGSCAPIGAPPMLSGDLRR